MPEAGDTSRGPLYDAAVPYVRVADLEVYYETDGDPSAPAVVLLHGAAGTIEDPGGWALLRPFLAQSHFLYLVEHRGHGRTRNPLGGLTFSQLTADLVGFIEVLGLAPVYLGGISDGGVAALGCCLDRPDLVRAAALIGTNYCVDARTAAAAAEFAPDRLLAEQPAAGEVLAQRHDAVNYSGYWRDLVGQIINMNAAGPSWSEVDLAGCEVPVLLVAGGEDPFANSDQLSVMERCIPVNEVLVVDHASHAVHYEHTELVADRIVEFFARH